MGRGNSKQRKTKQHLDKVPKYETPNTATGMDGGAGYGRSGHSSAHQQKGRMSRAGAYFLKLLGGGPKQ